MADRRHREEYDDRRRDEKRRRRRSEEYSPRRKRGSERSGSPDKRSARRRRDDIGGGERRNDYDRDRHSERERRHDGDRREPRKKEEKIESPVVLPCQSKVDTSPHRPWFDKTKGEGAESEPAVVVKKVEPDFSVSGKLAAETNTLNGVLIKYSEPPEARIPKTRWRFYEFKGDDLQNTLYLHRQSAYLIGRDRKVVDFPIDHPSCSKQHAALQYRLTDYVKDDGRKGKKVRPYVIDLESTNGTYVNNNRIEDKRYVELMEKDVVKFGFSSREYVMLHENSKDAEEDDEGEENPD